MWIGDRVSGGCIELGCVCVSSVGLYGLWCPWIFDIVGGGLWLLVAGLAGASVVIVVGVRSRIVGGLEVVGEGVFVGGGGGLECGLSSS